MKRNLKYIVRAVGHIALVMGLHACSSVSTDADRSSNIMLLGSYRAQYDVESKRFSVDAISGDPAQAALFENALTIADNSTGTRYGAIVDNSVPLGQINHYMGLVDPDSCSASYNSATKTLSFNMSLTNKSSIPDDGTPGVGYDYTDLVNYPPNTTYLTPFYFFLTSIVPEAGAPANLVQSVNTDLTFAECGYDGLTLSDINDDGDANGQFDCIYPDNGDASEFNVNKSDYPGWDFTSFVSGGSLAPGETTGCVGFAQFVLTADLGFSFTFDVVGIKYDAINTPDPPEVSTPVDNSYVNTTSLTIEGTTVGTSCDPAGTVHVDGAALPASVACNANGTYALNVTLNTNTTNALNVYQVVGTNQSGSTTINVTHDDIAPVLVNSVPSNGSTLVSRNTNCTFTFNEAMDQSTFVTGTTCGNGSFRMCEGNKFLPGSIAFGAGGDQALYIPTGKPLKANKPHNCSVTTAVTDLAGNALSANQTATFDTAPSSAAYNDITPPAISYAIPQDNAQVSPSSSVVVYFDEAIDGGTLNNVDGNCSGTVPNLSVYQTSGTCGVVGGSFGLNAEGNIASFTPTTPLLPSTDYVLIAQRCIEDASGNALPSRQSLTICGTDVVDYNLINGFQTTAGTETTPPELISISPEIGAVNVVQAVQPFMVFSEPLDAATVTSGNFFLTKSGIPTHLPAVISLDPTLQVVTFKPSSLLDTVTTASHTLTVTGSVADLSGNLIALPQTSSFSVAASADVTPPTVTSIQPSVDFATDPGGCGGGGNYISKCSTFEVRFSEPMDVTTLTPTNLELVNVSLNGCGTPGNKPALVEVLDGGYGVKLTPTSSMRSSGGCGGEKRQYYVQVQGVRDLAGNTLSGVHQSATYSACTETQAPSVTAIVPADGGSLSPNGSMAIFFDEPMDKGTLNGANIGFSGCTALVSVAADGRSAVANCALNTAGAGTLTINQAVRDAYTAANNANCEAGSGNQMGANVTATYGLAAIDTIPPTIANLGDVAPQDQTSGVATSVAPSVTFSEALDPRTVSQSSVFLVDQAGNRVDVTLSLSSDAQTITLTPLSPLPNNTVFYIIATTALRDLGGGLNYDGDGGEVTSTDGVLRSCFATGGASC